MMGSPPASPPVSHAFAYDMPLSGYSSIPGTQISIEPESIDMLDDPYLSYDIGQVDQVPPLHQNSSSSYPSSYTAVHRSQTPESKSKAVVTSHSLSSQPPSQTASSQSHSQHQGSFYPKQAGHQTANQPVAGISMRRAL